jgi:hypothetical protein
MALDFVTAQRLAGGRPLAWAISVDFAAAGNQTVLTADQIK